MKIPCEQVLTRMTWQKKQREMCLQAITNKAPVIFWINSVNCCWWTQTGDAFNKYSKDVFLHVLSILKRVTDQTQSFGFRNTSIISASRVPLAGSCMYSHLGGGGRLVRYQATDHHITQAPGNRFLSVQDSYLAVRGSDMRMLSILEPGVAKPNFTPRSYTRLNSTYLQQRNTHTHNLL